MDREADTSSAFNGQYAGWLPGLSLALLRDVREPVEQIFDREESVKHWTRIKTWRRMLLHRAATFYGTDSSQYRALYEYSQAGRSQTAAEMGMSPLDILPRWRHIQSIMSMADKPYEDQVIWKSILH